MPKITFIEHTGTEHIVNVKPGASLMEAAINHMVPGIEGDCGGLCACATCHVYVENEWNSKCEKAEELETSILDFAFDVRETCLLYTSPSPRDS